MAEKRCGLLRFSTTEKGEKLQICRPAGYVVPTLRFAPQSGTDKQKSSFFSLKKVGTVSANAFSLSGGKGQCDTGGEGPEQRVQRGQTHGKGRVTSKGGRERLLYFGRNEGKKRSRKRRRRRDKMAMQNGGRGGKEEGMNEKDSTFCMTTFPLSRPEKNGERKEK